jgi:hypothetical protein
VAGHRLQITGGVAARRTTGGIQARVLGGQPLDRHQVAAPGCHQGGRQVAEDRIGVRRVIHELGEGARHEIDVAAPIAIAVGLADERMAGQPAIKRSDVSEQAVTAAARKASAHRVPSPS